MQDGFFDGCEDQSNLGRGTGRVRPAGSAQRHGLAYVGSVGSLRQVGVHAQSCSIRLRESPEDIFGGLVDVGTT